MNSEPIMVNDPRESSMVLDLGGGGGEVGVSWPRT